MKKILGISAWFHDSAAALIIGGKPIAAAQEERFTRVKHTADFPLHAIRYCLDEAGLTLDGLDAVVFYEKPLLKFERLLESYYAFAPKGLPSFLRSMPLWLRDKLFLKTRIRQQLREVAPYQEKRLRLLFSEHHLSHAASAFYASPFSEAAVLTMDGVGEWATASIAHGRGREIQLIRELHFPHSIGLLYSAFTAYIGFRVNSGEYKLMGMAPYGNPADPQVADFTRKIEDKLLNIYPDGSVWLNQAYFSYASGLRMYHAARWQKLFGFPPRAPESALEQKHANLALAIQQLTEKIVLLMAAEARRLTGEKRLCLAGGVALNCVANARLRDAGIFEQLYIQPAAGDAGGALGAAWAASHLFFQEARSKEDSADLMAGAFLGPSFSGKEIETMAKKHKAVYVKIDAEQQLVEEVAAWLAQGKIVGWLQGRMEFGPRALGNRSILADAGNPDMQQFLNLRIKRREGFRPFAPSVPEEQAAQYFVMDSPSPYMLFTAQLRPEHLQELPSGFAELGWQEKLYTPKSALPAVTHVDFSARVQTVAQETNPRFYALLQAFAGITGYPVLLNTSFNVRGEPLVCTPEDAWNCFISTEMDYLVLENYVFDKQLQPASAIAQPFAAFQPD